LDSERQAFFFVQTPTWTIGLSATTYLSENAG